VVHQSGTPTKKIWQKNLVNQRFRGCGAGDEKKAHNLNKLLIFIVILTISKWFELKKWDTYMGHPHNF